jgi:ribonuclease PH
VALVDAIGYLQREKVIQGDPLLQMIASVSVGIYQGVPVLDLDYPEDSAADTDMNVIMGESGGFIEVQGTAEGAPFAREELNSMLDLAAEGINGLIGMQKEALASQ